MRNTKGSVMVEAAIFLPVFIIAVLSIGFIMKVFYVQEYMQHILADEVSKQGVEAYSNLKLENQQDALMSNIKDRMNGKCNNLHMNQMPQMLHYKYLFNGIYEKNHENHIKYNVNSDHLIEAVVLCKVDLPFKMRFTDDYDLIQRVIVRGWVGTERPADPMSFDDMSNKNAGTLVYVFPHSGEKYHKESCYIISDAHSPCLLTHALMTKYGPCKICDAGSLSLGSKVYIFRKSGTHFHSEACILVQEHVVGLELREAIDKGYKPCKICIK